MFVRVTHYSMKPDVIEQATAQLNQMKQQIMALPGTQQFINSVNADGSGCVITIVESREISDANQGAVQAIWAHFGDFLTAAPEPQGFDVVVNWSN